MANEVGYDQDRFENLNGDQFDCMICSSVVRSPFDCSGCGQMYCKGCITSWLKKKNECPNRCSATKDQIVPVTSRALLRIYNNLDIKCTYYDKCKTVVKLSDLEKHEQSCNKPKCINYNICQNNVADKYQKEMICDLPCLLLNQIKQNKDQPKQQLVEIKKFLNKYYNNPAPIQQQQQQQIPQPIIGGGGQMVPQQQNQNHSIRWSQQHKGQNIVVTPDGLGIYLKESAYMFRTIISDKPFMNGMHYWEIIADDRTENELKIGISTKPDFNYNSAFCDYEYGYSFYGLGQLRHNSNASGPQYGKRFKKEGTLGCFLNMNKGQLSFALNGEFLGIAFQHDNLKKGPIVAAVSLLHCAGCRLDSSKPIPHYFPK